MKLSSVLPFVIAIGLGGVAVRLGRDMLHRPTTGKPMLKVVVARHDIEPGYQLVAEDLTVAEMPQESLPAKAVMKTDEAVGRVVTVAMVKGQALVEAGLAPRGAGTGLQALVPNGMRAVTVDVNESAGMSGLLVPGCHVDVVATLFNEQSHQTVARTIVENVQVSAVGQRMGPRPSGSDLEVNNRISKTITLITTPRQAEAIELAAAKGKPRLVLRGGQDDGSSDTPGITIAELLGGAPDEPATRPTAVADMRTDPIEQAAPLPPQPVRRTIQVIKSGKETVKTFEMMSGEEGSSDSESQNGRG